MKNKANIGGGWVGVSWFGISTYGKYSAFGGIKNKANSKPMPAFGRKF